MPAKYMKYPEEKITGGGTKIQEGEIIPKFELELEFTGKMADYSSFKDFKSEVSELILMICNNTSVCY